MRGIMDRLKVAQEAGITYAEVLDNFGAGSGHANTIKNILKEQRGAMVTFEELLTLTISYYGELVNKEKEKYGLDWRSSESKHVEAGKKAYKRAMIDIKSNYTKANSYVSVVEKLLFAKFGLFLEICEPIKKEILGEDKDTKTDTCKMKNLKYFDITDDDGEIIGKIAIKDEKEDPNKKTKEIKTMKDSDNTTMPIQRRNVVNNVIEINEDRKDIQGTKDKKDNEDILVKKDNKRKRENFKESDIKEEDSTNDDLTWT